MLGKWLLLCQFDCSAWKGEGGQSSFKNCNAKACFPCLGSPLKYFSTKLIFENWSLLLGTWQYHFSYWELLTNRAHGNIGIHGTKYRGYRRKYTTDILENVRRIFDRIYHHPVDSIETFRGVIAKPDICTGSSQTTHRKHLQIGICTVLRPGLRGNGLAIRHY